MIYGACEEEGAVGRVIPLVVIIISIIVIISMIVSIINITITRIINNISSTINLTILSLILLVAYSECEEEDADHLPQPLMQTPYMRSLLSWLRLGWLKMK